MWEEKVKALLRELGISDENVQSVTFHASEGITVQRVIPGSRPRRIEIENRP